MTPCDYCGKDFLVAPYKFDIQERHFCSTECRQAWYAEVFSQTDEWREKSRERAVKILSENPQMTLTAPQKAVNGMLDELCIQYKNEEPFKYYAVDNYLPEQNLIVEVMGDYWHANPNKFPEIKQDCQLRSAGRDKAKHTYIKRYHKIEILYLWETDIIKRPELCKALISFYIEKNGVLDEYHSFNYELIDEQLTTKGQRVVPYQEMSSSEVKKHVKIAS